MPQSNRHEAKRRPRTLWPAVVIRGLCWLFAATLIAATLNEVALIIWPAHTGVDPDQPLASAAAFALIGGFFAAILSTIRPRVTSAIALYAPAGAAFVAAKFFTGDSYYFPTIRTYADGGIEPLWWILLLAGTSVLIGLAARARPRLGSLATALALPVILITLIGMGLGH